MGAMKTLWTVLWTVAIAAGFAGLGVFGLGLMIGAVWYPTGIFWGSIVLVLGALGVLLALASAMTVRNRPPVDTS